MSRYKNTVVRALRTFGQAAVGYIVANVALIRWDDRGALRTTVMTVVTAAVACGLAALMNLPTEVKNDDKEEHNA
ncbi:MAG: hypothetical protein IJS78_06480 [Clostridia bacterium]|nr:hypothetical protein [Clostridia bacterium]